VAKRNISEKICYAKLARLREINVLFATQKEVTKNQPLHDEGLALLVWLTLLTLTGLKRSASLQAKTNKNLALLLEPALASRWCSPSSRASSSSRAIFLHVNRPLKDVLVDSGSTCNVVDMKHGKRD